MKFDPTTDLSDYAKRIEAARLCEAYVKASEDEDAAPVEMSDADFAIDVLLMRPVKDDLNDLHAILCRIDKISRSVPGKHPTILIVDARADGDEVLSLGIHNVLRPFRHGPEYRAAVSKTLVTVGVTRATTVEFVFPRIGVTSGILNPPPSAAM